MHGCIWMYGSMRIAVNNILLDIQVLSLDSKVISKWKDGLYYHAVVVGFPRNTGM